MKSSNEGPGREIPFDEEAKCDECGAQGAFDFMGDFYCKACIEKFSENQVGDE